MWKTNVEEKDFNYVVNYIRDIFICRKQERKCLQLQVMPCKTQDRLKSPMLAKHQTLTAYHRNNN